MVNNWNNLVLNLVQTHTLEIVFPISYFYFLSKMAHILLIHKSPQGWTIMLSLVAYIFFARKTMISYLHWLCDIYRLLLIFWLQNSFCPKFHTGFMKLYSFPFNSMIVFSYCSWPFTTFNLYSCPFLNSSFFLKVWLSVSTIYRQTYLKKLQSQQKHALFYENKFSHTQELLKENNVLNIYQLKISIESKSMSNVFLSKFWRPLHLYPTSFPWNNYIVPSFKLAKSKYIITICTPELWNIILSIEERHRIACNFWSNYKKLKLLENAIM